ncbi:hypothetical protein U0070_008997, partial [Myodes glareolus]
PIGPRERPSPGSAAGAHSSLIAIGPARLGHGLPGWGWGERERERDGGNQQKMKYWCYVFSVLFARGLASSRATELIARQWGVAHSGMAKKYCRQGQCLQQATGKRVAWNSLFPLVSRGF